MKFKSLIYKIVILLIIIINVILCLIGYNNIKKIEKVNQYEFDLTKVNKVVLFIGDGMGENHIKTAETYLDKTMYMRSFNITGYVTTSSLVAAGPTDSAAAASAMATGIKYDNSRISKNSSGNIESISEYVKSLGYGVGIVTTDSLTGATPAAFSSHSLSRENNNEIISSQLQSNIDILLGSGKSTYDGRKSDITNAGYKYYSLFNELDINEDKIIGSFSSISNYTSTNETPTLEQLAEFAVQFLENKYPNGYFLMIEGAHIDKMSHNNNIIDMIKYLDEFDNTIKLITNMLKDDKHLFIVTADHETGNLEYNNETKDQISNSMYHATSHTSKNVLYYIDTSYNQDFPKNIDNTDIYKICKESFQKE